MPIIRFILRARATKRDGVGRRDRWWHELVLLFTLYVNLLSFYVNLLSFYVNLLCFYVNLLSFYVNLFVLTSTLG